MYADNKTTRREVFQAVGKGALALSISAVIAGQAGAATPQDSPNSAALSDLTRALAELPRRRGFEKVPFILNETGLWDHEAAGEVLSYQGSRRQMWEATDLAGPWLNLMRESLNGQVYSHGNKDFLAVAATHGSAHLALFTQKAWDKYNLAARSGGKFASNTLVVEAKGVTPDDDIQKVEGFYGPNNNNIVSLQRRGAVFIACHDSVHAIARGVQATPAFSQTSADEIAADLTNELVPGVILVPSVVAFIAELQSAGFSYAKAS